MSRHYDEPIEVRSGPDGTPQIFLRHGRPHVVRAVLDHWVQRHAWWRGAWADDADADLPAALEHDVWRVEAHAGRSAGAGVYDLLHHPSASQPERAWRLVRVLD